MLLTLRAEGNLAAGLLNEAAGVPDPSSLQPLQERFVAAANRAEKLLAQLPSAADDGSLKGITEALIGFGTSAGNIFDLRREELRQIAVAQASLQANNSLVLASWQGSGGTSRDRPEQQRCRGAPHRPGHRQWPALCFSSSLL